MPAAEARGALPPANPLAGASGSDRTNINTRSATDARTLAKLLRGDLDWIVMKALDKDRARRYAAASDLAADLQRHTAGEPVVAAPPSLVYRVRKFVRRNREAVVTGATVAGALLFGIAGTTLGLRRASSANRDLQLLVDEAKAGFVELSNRFGSDGRLTFVIDQNPLEGQWVKSYPDRNVIGNANGALVIVKKESAAVGRSRITEVEARGPGGESLLLRLLISKGLAHADNAIRQESALNAKVIELSGEVKRARLAEASLVMKECVEKDEVERWEDVLAIDNVIQARIDLLGPLHLDTLKARWVRGALVYRFIDANIGIEEMREVASLCELSRQATFELLVCMYDNLAISEILLGNLDESERAYHALRSVLSADPCISIDPIPCNEDDTSPFKVNFIHAVVTCGTSRMTPWIGRPVHWQGNTWDLARIDMLDQLESLLSGALKDRAGRSLAQLVHYAGDCRSVSLRLSQQLLTWGLASASWGSNCGDCTTALGLAYFRLMQFSEAIEATNEAIKLYKAAGASPRPSCFAVLAMANLRLGDREEAARVLSELRAVLSVISQPEGSGLHPDYQIVAETEELFGENLWHRASSVPASARPPR